MNDRHILTPADVERLRQRWARVQPGPARMHWAEDEVDDVSGAAFSAMACTACVVGAVALAALAWIIRAVQG